MTMDDQQWLTERLRQHEPHLRGVAYRMLGSANEADDALQETWLRIRDQDPAGIDNMQAWLTTVVGRVCLNMLRARRGRREELSSFQVPDPVVTFGDTPDPEQETVLADSVGLALLVVLDSLSPAERVSFVLHDVFAVPFVEIATVLERSEAAAQQLASRARRRVQGAPEPESDLRRQREVVDAFFAAARDGDFDALVEVLDPDVELRIDGGLLRREASVALRGAEAVARHTTTYARLHPSVLPAIVNGGAGAVVAPGGHVFAVMAFTVSRGRVSQIDALADPARLARLDVSVPPSADSRDGSRRRRAPRARRRR